mgnify:CR=1 FL=1|jgi:Acetyltransferases
MATSGEAKIDLAKLIIKPLDPSLDRAAFSCGVRTIDNWFRNNARKHHEAYKVRTNVGLYEGRIVGFYSLAAAGSAAEAISEEARQMFERVKVAPCIYLSMIGVDKQFQGKGIGKTLMVDAMRTTLRVAEMVGVYALILDALDKEVAKRYERWGFEYFIEGALRMYIPLSQIREAAAQSITAKAAASA